MHLTFPNLPTLLPGNLLSNFLPRSAHSKERFLVIFSCQIDEFLIGLLEKSDDIQSVLQKGIIDPLNDSPNRLSYGVFPSLRRSWMFRKK